MRTGKKYSVSEVMYWTSVETFVFIILATIPTVLYQVCGWHWLSIPWLPIALLGTAVAFIVGFKNNASYSRLWEARMIWGGIVNTSRKWAINIKDFVTNVSNMGSIQEYELKEIHRRLYYRHMAWLTALRYQLRQPRDWEDHESKSVLNFRKMYSIPEWEDNYQEVMAKYIPETEILYLNKKKNQATQLLGIQSSDLKKLKEKGLIEEYPYVELELLINEFLDHQGKAERIKNFPYPRQFATINSYFVWLFIILLPLGMLQEIESKLGNTYVWLTIPFSVMVAWVFHTMERIGTATENPFEGGPNDIPMAALSRTIEIDMCDMLDEENLPPAIQPVNNILM